MRLSFTIFERFNSAWQLANGIRDNGKAGVSIDFDRFHASEVGPIANIGAAVTVAVEF